MAMRQAETALDTIRRVERWAQSRGLKLPAGFAVDLGEAYRSAGLLTAGVERLLTHTSSREEDAKFSLSWRLGSTQISSITWIGCGNPLARSSASCCRAKGPTGSNPPVLEAPEARL